MANVDCPMGASNKARITSHDQRLGDHENRMDKLENILDNVRNRPTWFATTVISFLLSACFFMAAVIWKS